MINIDISTGEYLDRLSIARLKAERVKDPAKKKLAVKVYNDLRFAVPPHDHNDLEELYEINGYLWDIEDNIREVLKGHNSAESLPFSDLCNFVEDAYDVPKYNDNRARVKRRIDEKAGDVAEIKDYV